MLFNCLALGTGRVGWEGGEEEGVGGGGGLAAQTRKTVKSLQVWSPARPGVALSPSLFGLFGLGWRFIVVPSITRRLTNDRS